MPVWHELTKEWRESGDLQVVGIVQEQHPDRARLFAQWQGFDWPILWDPLNLTGSEAIPNLYAIDEHGVVRSTRPKADTFEEDFLDSTFDAPRAPKHDVAVTAKLGRGKEKSRDALHAQLMWQRGAAVDHVLENLPGIDEEQATPEDLFRTGVAWRMRYDSEHSRATDFQQAVRMWNLALSKRPGQYIWRRRLQQYGPRLDKPYPFYSWVDQAREELIARGDEPVELPTQLTASERLDPRATERSDGEVEPDPDRKIATSDVDWLEISSAACWPTQKKAGATARVHVDLRPARDVHWNNETEELTVWIDTDDDWKLTGRLHRCPNARTETSTEIRRIDFEVTPPEGATELSAYVLFNACEDVEGKCVYLRQDFKIVLER